MTCEHCQGEVDTPIGGPLEYKLTCACGLTVTAPGMSSDDVATLQARKLLSEPRPNEFAPEVLRTMHNVARRRTSWEGPWPG